jgi:DNA-binding NtrC family response regulator
MSIRPSSSERENIVSEPSKRNRIFVVDDEQVIALTLAAILRSHGFNATSFTQPFEALQAADSDVPDLLIPDVMMPLLSGIELAIQIQERYPNCKVLLFSGQASTVSMLDDARTHGCVFDILTKPVHPTDLLRNIQAITESMPPPATSLKQEF